MKKLKLQDTEDGCQAQSSVCTAVCVYVEQRGSFAVISANPVVKLQFGTNAFWLCIVFVLRQGEKKGWQSQWTHLPGKQVGWPHSLWPDSHNVRTQCYFKTVNCKRKKEEKKNPPTQISCFPVIQLLKHQPHGALTFSDLASRDFRLFVTFFSSSSRSQALLQRGRHTHGWFTERQSRGCAFVYAFSTLTILPPQLCPQLSPCLPPGSPVYGKSEFI